MLIDWFTVAAQTLNFLVLVWLLKRFLYQPILHAIDEREKRIAAELADAAAKKAESHKERDDFQHKNEEFDRQRAALLTKAMDEVKAERNRLLDEVRKAADDQRTKRLESFRSDARLLDQAVRERTAREVFAIARKALSDLAGASLDERMSDVFISRLRELNGEAKEVLGAAIKKSPVPTLIRSAFELPSVQQAAIQRALNETFSAEIPLRFDTAPDVINGIELAANGRKVAWSIADYLFSMEKGVGKLLDERSKTQVAAEVKVAPKSVKAKAETAAPTGAQ